MNKGLFIHILGSVIFIVMAMWIYSDEVLSKKDKGEICLLFFLVNFMLFTVIKMDGVDRTTNAYKEKI